MIPIPKRPVDHFDPNRHYSLLSLDPGNEKTGWALWAEGDGDKPSASGDHPNADIRQMLRVARDMMLLDQITCEFPFPRGEAAKWQVFFTCAEVGRYEEIIKGEAEVEAQLEDPVPAIFKPEPIPFYRADRADVKIHLCKKSNAKDGQVRATIIERFGGKEVALAKPVKQKIGGKRLHSPTLKDRPAGPLVGIVGDAWQALAVGLSFRDGALPDAEERKRREATKAQAKAERAMKVAKRLTDRQEVSQHAGNA